MRYRERSANGCQTERIGVKLRGDSRVYWFDSMHAVDDVSLPGVLEGALDWDWGQFLVAWAHAEQQAMALLVRV
jgi:hypothetical protein